MSTDERKVVVGMSGGVDSSVAAFLLQEAGYEVVGVMLKLWAEEGSGRDNACCSLASVNDARKVAAKIGIPFYLLDAADDFYRNVVEPFVATYLSGETPNPCATCNPEVRWRWLLNYADLIGAKYIATGHYARIAHEPDGSVILSRGADPKKDQSYVLSRIPAAGLSRSIFPLGELTKPQVREIARLAALPSSEKRESQDICFIADGDYRGFLRRHAGDRITPGNFVDRSGNVLGTHEGIPFYTIGQRKGIRISSAAPKYVLRKNADDGTIVIGGRDEISQSEIRLSDVNVLIDEPFEDQTYFAQTRYKAAAVEAAMNWDGDGNVTVQFKTSQSAISPGQICTLYNSDDQVVLSGTINLI